MKRDMNGLWSNSSAHIKRDFDAENSKELLREAGSGFRGMWAAIVNWFTVY